MHLCTVISTSSASYNIILLEKNTFKFLKSLSSENNAHDFRKQIIGILLKRDTNYLREYLSASLCLLSSL